MTRTNAVYPFSSDDLAPLELVCQHYCDNTHDNNADTLLCEVNRPEDAFRLSSFKVRLQSLTQWARVRHFGKRSMATIGQRQFVLRALGIMGALFQHSYTSAIQGRWGFLALGLLIWPVGILNGLGLWLGLW
jgi:hypothetical protein